VRLHAPPAAPFADAFPAVFAVAFNAANLLSLLALNVNSGSASAAAAPAPATPRALQAPLATVLAVLLGTAAVAAAPGVGGATVGAAALVAIAVLATCTSLIQAETLALANAMPRRYVQAAVTGFALGGVAVSLLSFFSQLRTPAGGGGSGPATAQGLAPSAETYFGAGAAVAAAAMAAAAFLERSPFARRHLARRGGAAAAEVGAEAAADGDALDAPLLPPAAADAEAAAAAILALPDGGALAACAPGEGGPAPEPVLHAAHPFCLYCYLMFGCLGITLCVFPGVTGFLCSVRNPSGSSPCAASSPDGRLYGDLFVPLTFLAFNLGDLGGRLLAGLRRGGPPAPRALAAYLAARGAIAAALLLCHVTPPAAWRPPQLLPSDTAALLLVLALGTTNGHLICTITSNAGRLLPASAAHVFGPAISLASTAGAFLGSLCSLGLLRALQV
jgi:hypothetical protein